MLDDTQTVSIPEESQHQELNVDEHMSLPEDEEAVDHTLGVVYEERMSEGSQQDSMLSEQIVLKEGEEVEEGQQLQGKISISDDDLKLCLLVGKKGGTESHEKHFQKLAQPSLKNAKIPESAIQGAVTDKLVVVMEQNLREAKEKLKDNNVDEDHLTKEEETYIKEYKVWKSGAHKTKELYGKYIVRCFAWFKAQNGHTLLCHLPAGQPEHYLDQDNPVSRIIKHPDELPLLHPFLVDNMGDSLRQLTEYSARIA